MDERLVAWARAVKSRHHGRGPPPLWLFTDPARTPDPVGSVRRLPRGLCGVVFRHDTMRGGASARTALARQVARACREHRIRMVVAGLPIMLPGVGRHLRPLDARRGPRPDTAAAHGTAELVRARRAGAGAVFLSPVFPTISHPGAPALKAVRWAALARHAGLPVLALGGIDGASVRRLPHWVCGVGAIGALL